MESETRARTGRRSCAAHAALSSSNTSWIRAENDCARGSPARPSPSACWCGPAPRRIDPAWPARLKLLPEADQVLHFPKGSGDDPGSARPERIDAMDYVARVLAQIPPPRKHLVRYNGCYSNAARGKRRA